ncbi:MAG: glycoside hydrolase family 2 TIM barrel-domain containing protein [Phycisphaerales bacterium]
MRTTVGLFIVGMCAAMVGGGAAGTSKKASGGVAMDRRVIDLDGTWQVAEGARIAIPEKFEHTVPVPGLIDMAEPAFEEVGKKSEKRQAFWYRRTFTVKGMAPPVAMLKIHKACYGTKVWLNGQVVGEHLPCFTPALLDVKPQLKGEGQENVLIVRVGADRGALPAGQPSGWDFEKYLYIPGIYDLVELILTGEPFINNIQVVPDISTGKAKVVTELRRPVGSGGDSISYEITEAKSGRVVGTFKLPKIAQAPSQTIHVSIPIRDCQLWSPENPFLYNLKVTTNGDSAETRFGMREFRFDRESGRAVLNGKPYFMRGTNVCAYRFFEDAERGDRPWRKDWVRRLHQKFKSMHWNSIRYCIGFPPEIWYDIADEEGFLIQDEFPIWTLGEDPEKVKAGPIMQEYVQWMRERWNHPCVVIWDAQNESNTAETGKALSTIRHWDLSNRPWDNGWGEPQSEADCVETHPYLMIGLFNSDWGSSKVKSLKDLANVSGVPPLNAAQQKLKLPIIINEYGWLWLNRDGTTTCLTGPVYEKLLGPNSTTEQRRELYAKYLAAKTEFWRAHRACAGVLHFCGLGYSRAGDKPRPEGGATSDHFIDMEKLRLEPNFEKYVRDAFSPVGIMLDYWGQDLPAGKDAEFKAIAINDTYEKWQGTLRLRIAAKDGKIVASREIPCTIEALGSANLSGVLAVPAEPGDCTVTAELVGHDEKPVRSVRDAKVVEVR